jgi:Skp family chaperone for outer membrane proteins
MSAYKGMLATSLVLGALSGCGKPGATEAPAAAAAPATRSVGGVAVVDLDAVARQLGRDIEMNTAVQERMSALNTKLTSLKTSLNRLFDEKRTGMGEDPTAEQQQELQTMQERLDVQLIESRRKAENELAVYKQQLIDDFREETKPVLTQVASDRGLSIVIPKNNGLLLSIDPAAEITDEVARRILASKSTGAGQTASKPEKPQATETSAR